MGSEPWGRSTAFAAVAIAAGVGSAAVESTSWSSAHAPEKPASAAAVIVPPKRSAYAACARSSRARPSGVRPATFSAPVAGLSEANSPTASSPSVEPNLGMQ